MSKEICSYDQMYIQYTITASPLKYVLYILVIVYYRLKHAGERVQCQNPKWHASVLLVDLHSTSKLERITS